MKKLYVIIPVVLMVAFICIFIYEKKAMDEARARDEAAAAEKQRAEEAHLAELREKSRLEAVAAAQKRDEEQAAKDKAKIDAFNTAVKLLTDARDNYIADQNKYKAQIADLQGQLDKIRADKESLSRQSIDMNQTIVAGLIERQKAETDVQRLAMMVARQASDSPLTRPTVPAAPAAPPASQ